ncbi:MAG: electron transfer flavoprotein subunit beta/FixA family protein [Deltaproteobacteria bacterium]|nr:electron transfer flavoprotein subunit beta/FixA family protein [Deltaproteobacteria bacterium]
MKIVVPLNQVPDLVEDLEIADSGKELDFEVLKMKLNEFDDHALEEALQIKESSGGEVTAVAVDGPEVDKVLFTALAKGADKAVKITGANPHADNHTQARVLAGAVGQLGADLVLVGVQSAGDRDGQLGPLLAAYLNWPGVCVVSGLKPEGGKLTFHKEYAGGLMAEFEVDLPAVMGVQAARATPRYAPVSKVRQVQTTAKIESLAAAAAGDVPAASVEKMEPPVKGAGAKMLKSAADIIQVLKEKGVV